MLLSFNFFPVTTKPSSEAGVESFEEKLSPAILSTNYYQHKKGEQLHFELVCSRMLIWNIEGKGSIVVNGETYELKPNQFAILPWAHEITYLPDEESPFATGNIHFAPKYFSDKLIENSMSFHFDEKPSELSGLKMSDAEIPGLEKVIVGSFAEESIFRKLCDYIAFSYSRGVSLLESRTQASMLIKEIRAFINKETDPSKQYPANLNRMIQYICENFDRNIQIDELSKIGNCSKTTVFRLFETHLKTTPINYAAQLKVDKAKDILWRSTEPINIIADKLGFSDAFYFSKFFSKHVGVSPSKYRKQFSEN